MAPQAADAGAQRRRHVRGAEPLAAGAGRHHRRHPADAGGGHAGAAPLAPRGGPDRDPVPQAAPGHTRAAGHAAAGQRRPARGHARCWGGRWTLSDRLRTTSVALRDLIRDPNTQRSLGNLRTAVALLKPTLNFVAPVPDGLQLRELLLPPAGRAPVPAGARRQRPAAAGPHGEPGPAQQRWGTTFSSRPWDLQPGQSAHGATFDGQPAGRPMAPPYQPAIDAAGNADCQNGQDGFPDVPPDRGLRAQERRGRAPATPTTS